jgi:GTP-binding protein HflX
MKKEKFQVTPLPKEKAILVGIAKKGEEEKIKDHLKELAFLTETSGAIPVKSFIQKLNKPYPSTFIGTGKIEEILLYLTMNFLLPN